MKAHWIKKYKEDSYYCSNCGPKRMSISCYYDPKEKGNNFCSYCGAEMGETVEEEKIPMTKEEAIKELEDASTEELKNLDITYNKAFQLDIERRIEAFDMAIKALKGEE